ncbi:MAG: hypothetical protein ABEJ22_03145 [Haloferacaceae archaeon]
MLSTLADGLSSGRCRLGSAGREFDRCDATFLVRVEGIRDGAVALATTLSVRSVLPMLPALSLVDTPAPAADWPGGAALVVHGGDRFATDGFDAHVYDA